MWNDVLNKFIELKYRFVNLFGEDKLWAYGEYSNCIEYWASKFKDFNEMFSPLIINEHKDFVLIRYNLMDTDAKFWNKYNGLYRECRSIVLDKQNDCIVLSPFRKFFNLNETEETAEKLIRQHITLATNVEVSDKMDGSMQSARYYNGNIVLAGTRALDPEQSFRVQIGYSLLDDNYRRMLQDNPDYTFIFELICKEDQHVVIYQEDQRGLYLIGMRNVLTGEELAYAKVIATAKSYGVKHTIIFNKTLDELLMSLDDKRSDEAEGFVIDIDGYKVKLKYNDYLTIHHMLKKIVSTNVIIKCIDDGTWDDVRSKMPEAYRADADIVANDVKAYVRMMRAKINKLYKDCCNACAVDVDRKTFAMYVISNHKKYAHYLINMFDGKENNFIHSRFGRYLRYREIKDLLANGGD